MPKLAPKLGLKSRRNIVWFIAAILPLSPLGADTKEEPVGLVLTASGSQLLRADTETPLAARPGDLLFAGDGLRTQNGPASFLFCPGKSLDTLTPSGEVRLEAKTPKVKSGKISEQPARACTLPQTLRVAVASEQHYGVSMTRGLNEPPIPPTPHDKLPADVQTELSPYETALAANPKDQAALVAEATIFENHKLDANALEEYNKLLAQWPDAVWIKSKIFELGQTLADQAAAATAAAKTGGQTYALLVGISKYAKPELALQFADADASVFSKLLESPLGGGVPRDNILLLTDEKATTAAVRNGFQDFLKRRAGKNDTVVILIAGHGTVEVPGSRDAFILTYDSDPQDLKSTALAVDELQSLFTEQLSKVGRVLLFVDVCKAGTVGTIHNTTINSNVQQLGDIQGDLFGLLASRPREVSLEGPQFGGGHGVFSYFVIKGLEGAADANKDGVVDADELIKYVSDQVPMATDNKQHPREFGTYDDMMRLSDTRKKGIDVARWPVILDSRTGGPLYLAGAPQGQVAGAQAAQAETQAAAGRLTAAINAGRILPTDPNNAFTALRDLKATARPEQYQEAENQLRIALENKGQQVLLRYLAGDETPQSRNEFEDGSRYMEAARTLTKESLYLEGREDFFQGRALLFDKKFPQAASLLEQSVRIDPGGAYGFNALGIAYLEQAEYDKAIPAFHDAVRRAQHWSYPLHNEALAYVETGDYRSAIRAYQQAIRLTPQYSYLPYNLGLVYQRLNRRKDAEAEYLKAEMLAPNSAEPYNALGTLKASEGKRADAEKLYQQALKADPKLLAARHNLALLIEDEPNRRNEAIELWRQNLAQSPDYLPSRLSLAGALATAGDNAQAIAEYRKVLVAKPEYVAARNALADLLEKTGDRDGALDQLQQVAKQDSQDPAVFERIGDLEAQGAHAAEARAAYQSALNLKPARAERKRIAKKLKDVAGK
ncbi:MAG TPA: tetratricopeptide repeat protein [Bryobacteraceae bacterium]|nr:tetratricopeptide repeat protein [Bryobacteraceae bacterium]